MADATTELLSAPLTFNWTLSFRCNFSCSHCYSRDEIAEELSTADLKRIVDILADRQVPFINFGGGEPLIREDLFEVATYASSKGLRVSMNSNGWLIDGAVGQKLKDAGFASVGISLDSADALLHDDFRNMPGSYDRALRALDSLRSVGLASTMSSVISRINYRDYPRLLDLARSYGVGQVYLHNFKCSGRGFKNREELDLDPGEWKAFYQEALQVKAETTDLNISFDDPVIASLPGYQENPLVKGSSCGKLSLHLRPNGDITPCGFIPLVVGNILRDDFDAIWYDSPVLKGMRHKEATGKCSGCGSFADCLGGCTARAFATTGEFNQPDPHCWK
ncbi:GeoRSP system radical SAM/SPASM protein [Desulfuromonas carbonis]|uniref:GeoRSP system radical SAM/SPASM protein n=1 Tax=Desulfuromonas sp. DDH964 TaxID=1823759 RepID=UPI00078DCF5D|nr:GeoRSP system radical SAM/SPASM protein [Desulfuromonas sp. DDH964]AMV72403.1 radical SAM domain-containing iron-sulfur cluster-binding oxidoreductase [Desulfuromonas sp. DDH964]